jgi:glycosyltransferase involved in cell wall biosynthesis
MADVSPVQGLPNVHLLGRKPHDQLAAYCKGFDVGLIPYRIDERMRFVNPIKLREYLAAGLPVVSTAVPEVRRYPALATVADDHAAFIAGVELALASDSPAARAARSDAMRSETWHARVAECAAAVEHAAARRRR